MSLEIPNLTKLLTLLPDKSLALHLVRVFERHKELDELRSELIRTIKNRVEENKKELQCE